ncbi:nucleotide sugar dehydrogenase [Aporhodopirellula aestuarii]|uniref:Nucleotide sugar dehydrogenase n=1 Tax=Aporhodopirellula aestuarii TaxID=2950107 RepID=A0ABT0U977_9BACT|nr:nucleotide sugar dehydrogenase [Aporhodopirellula aestuarii]MCM2373527.1 nucleotide sugar dehydrogenase [Aporhodopirellula aestuarii]
MKTSSAVTDTLTKRIRSKEASIGIVGLGYVGLPLAISYADGGFNTIGFDIDAEKTKQINAGQSYIKHIPADTIGRGVRAGKLAATTDFSQIREVDAIILCVPTPLDEHFEPDLSYVVKTIEAIVPYMRANQAISLESTTYPGTTEEELVSRVEAAGLRVGIDAFVIYSPEREDPGNPEFAATNIPKVVGGHTPACLAAGTELYGSVFQKIVPVSSTAVAELTKLLENIYRSVNIGLVNELKLVADSMGIDIWEVIAAASTKPFGFKPFYPGPGLGGHCIPIDPFYLTWKAREFGIHTRFIELAGEINRSMPAHVVRRCADALNTQKKPLNGSRVLLIGLAYKPNVDDDRESPSYELLDRFQAAGSEIDYHDPYVPIIRPSREHAHWAGKESVYWDQNTIAGYDLVVISTWHECLNIDELAQWSQFIVDTRNATATLSADIRLAKTLKA